MTKSFKDFGIKAPEKGLKGDKMKIDRILNRKILVEKFYIVDSTVKPGTKRLDMQFKVDENQHILFSGSNNLMYMIQQVPEDGFPFEATIIKNNDKFEFV